MKLTFMSVVVGVLVFATPAHADTTTTTTAPSTTAPAETTQTPAPTTTVRPVITVQTAPATTPALPGGITPGQLNPTVVSQVEAGQVQEVGGSTDISAPTTAAPQPQSGTGNGSNSGSQPSVAPEGSSTPTVVAAPADSVAGSVVEPVVDSVAPAPVDGATTPGAPLPKQARAVSSSNSSTWSAVGSKLNQNRTLLAVLVALGVLVMAARRRQTAPATV